jgi:radical SAM superfamily enzyme YgiQ (UPF0313 family)
LLVSPPHDAAQAPGSGRYLSVGLTLVGTLLKQAGFDVTLLDGAIDPRYEARYREALADPNLCMVGFSVMSSQVGDACRLSADAKQQRPKIPAVWGGFHPTIFPHQTVADPAVDIVVAGEAVGVIVPLARALISNVPLASVPGVYFRNDDGIQSTPSPPFVDFASIPDLDWSLYDRETLDKAMQQQNARGKTVRCLPILSGLGCKYRCAFCFNAIFGVPHRSMNAERIITTMRRLQQDYSIDEVIFYDELFFGDKDRAEELVARLEEAALGLQFFASIRASEISSLNRNQDFLKRLRAVGGHNFGVGAESGNQRVLNLLTKGISVDDIRASAATGKRYDIVFNYSFMLGLPGEKLSEVFDTLHLIHEIVSMNAGHAIIGPQIFRPYPGSALFDKAINAGLTLPASLKEWSTQSTMTRVRRIARGTLPWVDKPRLLERIIRTYNIQSYNAPLTHLQDVFCNAMTERYRSKGRSERFLPRYQAFCRALVKNVVRIARWRIRHRSVRIMPEFRLVRCLDELYFTRD